MANRPLNMQKIRQILLFWERGFSQRAIERKTGINRRTIASSLQVLWQKFINEYPDGFGYSRFCELLQESIRKQGATMRFEHEPGKLLQ